ncbi:MAG: ABC transporter permease [Bacteroidota bacterium]
MQLQRIVKSGFKTMWAHKLRALFMFLSVMIGIAALTVIISLGKGTQEKIMGQVQKLFSSNTIMVVAGKGRMEGGHERPASAALMNLKPEDFEEIAERVDNVVEWDAIQIAPDRQVSYEGKNSTAAISGQTTSAESVWNIDVVKGRFFDDTEDKNLSRVALIAPNIVKELFGGADPIGQQIRVDNIPFQVIGVVGPRGMDPHGIDKDSEIIVPLNTLLRRVVNLDYLMMGKLLTADESIIPTTADEVAQILRERHSIVSKDDDDFIIITPTMVGEMIKDATKMFNLYLPLVAAISLIVGSIVIANLMLISVNERVKEIGLRKAVGAKSKDILAQFLIEASSITILSGALGIIAGLVILSQVGPRFFDIPFSISWGVLFICFIISTLIGIASGFFPAKRAAKLEPVEALR